MSKVLKPNLKPQPVVWARIDSANLYTSCKSQCLIPI
jgi:hypothetical protein